LAPIPFQNRQLIIGIDVFNPEKLHYLTNIRSAKLFKRYYISNTRFKKEILEPILLVSNKTDNLNYWANTFDGRLEIFSTLTQNIALPSFSMI
jgi:hypothetical protein